MADVIVYVGRAGSSPTGVTTTKPIRLLDTSIPPNKSGRYTSMVTRGKVPSGLMSLGFLPALPMNSSDSPTSTRPEWRPREEASASPDSRKSSSPQQQLPSSGGASPRSSTKTPTSCGEDLPASTTSPDQAGDSPILCSCNTLRTSMNWSPRNWNEKQKHADQTWMENLYEDSQDPWIPYISGMTTPTVSEPSTQIRIISL